ncbi:MAG: FixH family protein [Bacteroidia bacterium]|nr:FixH family protein [Bacteroidia bacterium]
MKTIQSIMLNTVIFFMGASILLTSCKKENMTEQPKSTNEVQGLKLVSTLENNTHKINLYTLNGKFSMGYNSVFFQIKNTDGSLVKNATATWQPMMHMMKKSHSCPSSSIKKKAGATSTYQGSIVFQMASNDQEYWELTVNYTIDGKEYSATDTIVVEAVTNRVVSVFKGSDNISYIIALVEPSQPKIGMNAMKAVLYKMVDMNAFELVQGFKINIDPRMPDMGNHSSPNNINLIEDNEMYVGSVNFTMTGFWRISLMVYDSSDDLIKGEEVTIDNPNSSLFFEVGF